MQQQSVATHTICCKCCFNHFEAAWNHLEAIINNIIQIEVIEVCVSVSSFPKSKSLQAKHQAIPQLLDFVQKSIITRCKFKYLCFLEYKKLSKIKKNLKHTN